MRAADRRALLCANQTGHRLGDPRPQLKAVGGARMQRAPGLGDIQRRGPMLLNQYRGQLVNFMIGHPMNVKPAGRP